MPNNPPEIITPLDPDKWMFEIVQSLWQVENELLWDVDAMHPDVLWEWLDVIVPCTVRFLMWLSDMCPKKPGYSWLWF